MGYSRVAAPAAGGAPAGAARDHRRHPHRDGHHHRARHGHRARSARAGSGALMLDGLQRDFRTPLTVGIVLSLALAIVADLLLVLAQRLATPWQRAGRRSAPYGGGVMGFLGDVFDFLTNHDQWHGNESIPTLAGQHLQLTVVSVLVAGGRRAPDRHRPRARAHGRRGGGEHRQHRPRAARVRAAHPRRCSGSASATRPASSPRCSRSRRSSPCSPSRSRRCSPTCTSAWRASTTRSARRRGAWA